jgi:hypothetical protein
MNKSTLMQSLGLMAVSCMVYWAAFEVQHLIFAFTEYIPGVNWFYLPSGVRVVLVLIGGVSGALGISLATVLIDWAHYPHITGLMLVTTAFASGFSAYLALLIMRSQGKIEHDLQGLSLMTLLSYSALYSAINSLAHQLNWRLNNPESHLVHIDIWPMFVGDLLGAVALLLLVRLIFRFKA